MKKSIICLILIITTLMSAGVSSVSGKTTDNSFESRVAVLEGLGFLDESLIAAEKTELVTYGQFAAAVSRIKNTDCTEFSDEYITVANAVDLAAYQFGYGYFIGKENTEYASYKRELLSGVEENYSGILTVETTVEILYNIIRTPVMIRTSYGTVANFEVYENRTPLTEYHSIYFSKGRVTANSITAIDSFETTEKDCIRINDAVYKAADNYSDYIGRYVEFYYKYDKHSQTRTILYMSKTERENEVVISAYDLAGFDNLTYSYYENNRSKTVKITPVHTVILNGKRLEVYEADVYMPKNGTVTLISNNKGQYDVVVIESFVSFPLLSVTAGGTDEIVFTERYTNRIFALETDNTNGDFKLYINGEWQNLERFEWEHNGEIYETVTLPQIPKNSVVNIFADKYKDTGDFIVPADDAEYIKINITTNVVEGFVDSIADGDKLIISGQEYGIAAENSLERGISFPKLGEKGIFMLDCDNKITAWARDFANNRSLDYAYLINAAVEDGLDGKLRVKMLLNSGDIKVFTARKKVILNSATEKDPNVALSKLKDSAKFLDPSFKISQLVKFRTDENGEICEIQTVLRDIGLPDGVDREHIHRAVPREKFYSRSDNGYSLYRYVADWPNTATYLKPDIIFSVPTTETFDEDDYNICYTWTPDYSGKTVDIFDVDDYLKPQAVVAYETAANSIFRPYIMVEEITKELNQKGEAVSVLRGYDGYDSMVFYSDDFSMFNGLDEGDLVSVYGFGNKITQRPQLIVSIDDVKNFDYTDVPRNTVEMNSDCCLYELYAYEGRSLTLQRGNANALGKREFQKGAYWTTNVGSLHYGAIVYDAEERYGNRITSSPDTAVMRSVISYGNEKASKMFVYETSGICRLVVIYNGL